MKKEQLVDWSKHELHVRKEGTFIIHHLKIPGTICGNVKFINGEGILSITGDYGNWIFCRPFIPSKESDYSSLGYWMEKASIYSSQKLSKYCPRETEERIKERIEELQESESKYSEDMIEYYTDLLTYVDDEYEYINEARNFPSGADYDDMIVGKELDCHFIIVLEAYDEIVRRYKEDLV